MTDAFKNVTTLNISQANPIHITSAKKVMFLPLYVFVLYVCQQDDLKVVEF